MIAAAAVLLAGCGDGATPEEQAQQAERDVAMVEAANNSRPPVREVTPDPILLPDIEEFDLYGAACNYAPGTSLGTRVVAREADAFIKIDGEVFRLAADPGSRELPMNTRTLYSGREYSLRLELHGEEAEAESEKADYEGTVIVRDQWGRTVYEGTGLAQCSG